MKTLKAHPALMTLTVVIVISSIALLVAVFVVVSGVDLVQQGLYDSEYNETLVGADGCMEEVLVKLNADSSYTGENFTIGSVDCSATISGGGSTRSISITATQGAVYVSDLEISVDVSTSPISITNWEQVN